MSKSKLSVEKLRNLLESEYYCEGSGQLIDTIDKNSKADNSHLTLLREVIGLGSFKQRCFLSQLLSQFTDINYLEVGMYNGDSMVGALVNNENTFRKVVGCDNWKWGGGSRQEFEKTVSRHLENFYDRDFLFIDKNSKVFNIDTDLFDVSFIKENCFVAQDIIKEEFNNEKIDIYFYDGDHGSESQKHALTKFVHLFADEMIYIADDCQHPDVVRGRLEGLGGIPYDILYQANTAEWDKDVQDKLVGAIEPYNVQYTWGGGWWITYLKRRT